MRSSSNESSHKGHETPMLCNVGQWKSDAMPIHIVSANDVPVVGICFELATRCELARNSEETEKCLCGPALWSCIPLFVLVGTILGRSILNHKHVVLLIAKSNNSIHGAQALHACKRSVFLPCAQIFASIKTLKCYQISLGVIKPVLGQLSAA